MDFRRLTPALVVRLEVWSYLRQYIFLEMARNKTLFVCSECGHSEPKWTGRCPDCGEWNTFHETKAGDGNVGAADAAVASRPLYAITADDGARIQTRIDEVDRALGGGLMKGSSVLVGGEPGIGKSTLMLQIAASADTRGRVLYVSGEESAGQLRMRAERLSIADSAVEVLCSADLGAVTKSLQTLKPSLAVIDSIQTIIAPELGSMPGTVGQIRHGCHEIVSLAREHGTSILLVAHVTKEGAIAGPKIIEHMVDTVLYFDQSSSDLRILRAAKNRFGSIDEIGLFTMTAAGLSQVKNPSSLFLVHREGEMPPGVIVAPVYEGTRVLLVEIQALVVPAKSGVSRTFSERIDAGRVSRVAAVLEKHLKVRFSDQDVYVNVAGGIRINEVGIELPLALALYSARTSLPVPQATVAAGEITLAGEIRPIPAMSRRVKTAQELAFTRFIGPPATEPNDEAGWKSLSAIEDAVAAVFGRRK